MSKVKISYNETDVAKSLKRAVLKKGCYAGVVTSTQDIETKKGHLAVGIILQPLRDKDDVNSVENPSIRELCILPFPNPEKEDHQPMDSNTCISLAHQRFCALYPDTHPRNPTKVDGEWYYKEERIEPEDIDKCRLEVSSATWKKCEELYYSPEELEGKFVYFTVEHNGDYTNVGKLFSPDAYKLALENDEDDELKLVEWDEKTGFKHVE